MRIGGFFLGELLCYLPCGCLATQYRHCEWALAAHGPFAVARRSINNRITAVGRWPLSTATQHSRLA